MKTNYITNCIATNFNKLGLVTRYQNDPRDTPTDVLWCRISVDLGKTVQHEIGTNSYRYVGNLNVSIKNEIGLGLNNLLATADVISLAFRNKILNRINFQVPRIINVGRIDDNYQVNVILPFFAYSKYLVPIDLIGTVLGVVLSVSGSLEVATELQSSIVGTSDVLGFLNIAIGLVVISGELDIVSGTIGSLDSQPELISSVAGVSDVLGSLDSQPGLGSSIVEISSSTSFLGKLGVLTLVAGATAGPSSVSGSLNVATKLQGSIAGIFDIEGSLDSQPELISFVVGVFDVLGALDSQPKLQGNIISGISTIGQSSISISLVGSTAVISNVSGSLNVATKLQGLAAGISGAEGKFEVPSLIPIQGSVVGTSNVSGSLSLQSELQGSIAGTSGVEGLLEFLTRVISIQGSVDGISDISGSLNVTTGLQGFIAGTSDVSGIFAGFKGSVSAISNVNGILYGLKLEGSINAISNVFLIAGSKTWTTPASHNDVDNGWTNETRAYNDNEADYATSLGSFASYGRSLEFIHPSTAVDKVRFLLRKDNNDSWVWVQIHYYDGSWHLIATEQSITITKTWYEFSLGGVKTGVTKYKLLWRFDVGEPNGPRIYETDYDLVIIAANLNVSTSLVGSVSGISSVSGIANRHLIGGSTNGTSNVSGSLDVATELKSSISSVSNISGSLSVSTKLSGSVIAESTIEGSLYEMAYVDRGDPVNYDFNVGDFTTDNTWRDLDLSAIVPAGVELVHLNLFLRDDASNSYVFFRKNGNSNDRVVSGGRTQVADLAIDFPDVWVTCDVNRVIQYWAKNTVFTNIDLVVKGWWI